MPESLRQVLLVLCKNPHATYAIIAKAIGRNRDTVSKYLSKLQTTYKLIKRVGSDKTGYWIVLNTTELDQGGISKSSDRDDE